MNYNRQNRQFSEIRSYGKGRTIKPMPQTGKVKSIIRDMGRVASQPGKRISKTGNVYWETRKNRTDTAYGMT